MDAMIELELLLAIHFNYQAKYIINKFKHDII